MPDESRDFSASLSTRARSSRATVEETFSTPVTLHVQLCGSVLSAIPASYRNSITQSERGCIWQVRTRRSAASSGDSASSE